MADLLRVHAREPEAELENLVKLAAYTVAIGNTDLHGKNISLLDAVSGSVLDADLAAAVSARARAILG